MTQTMKRYWKGTTIAATLAFGGCLALGLADAIAQGKENPAPLVMASAEDPNNPSETLVPAAYVPSQKSEDGGIEAGSSDGTRVFGGRPAAEGAYPWQAALMMGQVDPNDPEARFNAQFCGGTLLTREWVLTAAHCVFDGDGNRLQPGAFQILTGTTDLRQGGDFREVGQVIVHEAYDPVLLENDIALVRLSQSIGNSSGPVGAIRIARSPQEVREGSALLIGWGRTEDGSFPYDLLETDLDLVANEVCNRGLQSLYEDELAMMLERLGGSNRVPEAARRQAYDILVGSGFQAVPETQLCAGVASGERSSCNGDSGGPLMVRDAEGRLVQVGIVSWGRVPLTADGSCGHANLYTSYTRIPSYFDWIASHVQR
ncbi:MAG: serine protease [Pseudomonadota bacterium]